MDYSSVRNTTDRAVADLGVQTSSTLLRQPTMDRLNLTDEQASALRVLRNAQEKVMRYRLHRDFLHRYHQAGIIPRGLNLKCAPYLGAADSNLDRDWADTLKAAALNLLALTI